MICYCPFREYPLFIYVTLSIFNPSKIMLICPNELVLFLVLFSASINMQKCCFMRKLVGPNDLQGLFLWWIEPSLWCASWFFSLTILVILRYNCKRVSYYIFVIAYFNWCISILIFVVFGLYIITWINY